MEQELPQLLQGLKPERLLAVIMIKIPLLRDIRTQWGTDYVNSVLADLTHRIKDSLYSYDLLARFYDDTLVLIRPNAADKREVTGLVNSIQTIIMHPSKIEGQELSFQSTAGISLAPQDATQTLTILSNAEEALADARRIEMDYLYFDQLQTFAVDERLQLWKDIQQALEDHQFFLVFQPLFDLRSNKLLSAEVLLRWQHPKRGFISPAVFVAFAEQSGLVSRLDNWVIRATLSQLKKWQDAGLELPKLAINLSGLTFVRTDLAALLKDAAAAYDVPLSHLELELTEGVLIDSMEQVQSKIEAVKALGVSISIDDFGTGYSSLSRIRNLPIDKVKIDRSFIEELENSHGDRKIIEGITHMAQGLGFKVVAEGVETLEQLNLLRTMNCDIVQGFLLSKPIPPDDLMALLEQQNFVIEDGKVIAIGQAPDAAITETIDATGLVVTPGLVDLCAHLREPGLTQKGNIASETAAAAAAGITTLATPPTTAPVIDTPAVAELIIDRAEATGLTQVLPMGALTRGLQGEQLAPLHALHSSGCVAFTNARQPVASSLVLLRCLEYAATHNFLVIFQPQDASLAAKGCMHDGTTCTRLGLNGIPESAETVELARCLLLVEQT
ncbi:predicted protein, partial [Nematostella vectensis]